MPLAQLCVHPAQQARAQVIDAPLGRLRQLLVPVVRKVGLKVAELLLEVSIDRQLD